MSASIHASLSPPEGRSTFLELRYWPAFEHVGSVQSSFVELAVLPDPNFLRMLSADYLGFSCLGGCAHFRGSCSQMVLLLYGGVFCRSY